MEAGASARLRIAGTVLVLGVAATAALSLIPRPAGAGEPPATLLPDLVVPKVKELYVEKGAKRTMLRFSHTTANVGGGPLEISPDLEDPGCAGGPNGYAAYQYVYSDMNSSGLFERAEDGLPEQQSVPGCMYFHQAHNHYHFRDFALYDLHSERTGKLVATSDKVSFCVFDLTPFRPKPPVTEPFYGFANCDRQDGTHGISVGWADVYAAGTAGQQLNVTGMRRGRYCLVAAADPEGRLNEIAPDNNARRMRIALRPRRGFVKPLDGPCRLP